MSLVREIIKTATRSKGWRKVRNEHVKAHPICAACGRTDGLEVHHIEDFSTKPELELDPNNLITLCDKAMRCHLTFGHLGNWKSINPEVIKDSIWFLDKVINRRGKKDGGQKLHSEETQEEKEG